MAIILQTPFSNSFPRKQMRVFWCKYHWSFLKGHIVNKSALIQIMAWCRMSGRPSSEQWWPSSLAPIICLSASTWVNRYFKRVSTYRCATRSTLPALSIMDVFVSVLCNSHQQGLSLWNKTLQRQHLSHWPTLCSACFCVKCTCRNL